MNSHVYFPNYVVQPSVYLYRKMVAPCKDGPFSDWLCHNVSCNAVKIYGTSFGRITHCFGICSSWLRLWQGGFHLVSVSDPWFTQPCYNLARHLVVTACYHFVTSIAIRVVTYLLQACMSREVMVADFAVSESVLNPKQSHTGIQECIGHDS